MKDINKIIDSLSPVEQLIMCNALQRRLNKGPEYSVGTDMAITLMLIMDHLELVDLKRKNMLN